MKIGFDNEKYVSMQSERILERIKQNGNKLYLEFGGKLFDDLHAARVLPGFAPDAKIRILQKLKDQTEIIFVINAGDIERKKMRADFGISYEMDVLRLIDHLRAIHILVSSIVITRYNGQPSADIFKKKLAIRGERVYVHNTIPMMWIPSSAKMGMVPMSTLKLPVPWWWSPHPVPAAVKWRLAFPSYTMSTNEICKRDMPSLKPSPFGTFPSNTRSIWLTKQPQPISMI
jgi:hypothetical protein